MHKDPISIHIKIYLQSLVDYQHLKKFFYNWNITLNYCFIYKTNIRGNLTGYAPDITWNAYILRPPFHPLVNDSKWCVDSAKDHVFQNFRVFLWWQNKLFPVCLFMTRRSQTEKIIFFFWNFYPHNTRFNRKRVITSMKNVDLWQEFALFEVNRVYLIIVWKIIPTLQNKFL